MVGLSLCSAAVLHLLACSGGRCPARSGPIAARCGTFVVHACCLVGSSARALGVTPSPRASGPLGPALPRMGEMDPGQGDGPSSVGNGGRRRSPRSAQYRSEVAGLFPIASRKVAAASCFPPQAALLRRRSAAARQAARCGVREDKPRQPCFCQRFALGFGGQAAGGPARATPLMPGAISEEREPALACKVEDVASEAGPPSAARVALQRLDRRKRHTSAATRARPDSRADRTPPPCMGAAFPSGSGCSRQSRCDPSDVLCGLGGG